jgi:hypothetical protein
MMLFFVVASSYCSANNLDLTPEAETGRGPVDFKISSGNHGRLLVEVKLSTSSRLLSGYTTQLELYKKGKAVERINCPEVGRTARKPAIDVSAAGLKSTQYTSSPRSANGRAFLPHPQGASRIGPWKVHQVL